MIVSGPAPEVRQLALGGIRGSAMPLDRVDHGVFLAATQRLRLARERPGGLHVEAYEYRVGWSDRTADWIVRWDYEEFTRPGYVHPRAHLHFNATAVNERFLATELGKAHFVTQKMLLEQVLLSICTDIVTPRLVTRGKETGAVDEAIIVLEAELAKLLGRFL